VSVRGQRYDIPAVYRPAFGRRDGSNFEKYLKHGLADIYAYCMFVSDASADVYLSFPKIRELWKTRSQLSGVYYLTVGRHSKYGSNNKFEVFNTCDSPGSPQNDCRISLWSEKGILIQADTHSVPVDKWGEKVEAVKDFVQSLESMP
jgi:hypothetical protein